MPQSPTGSGVHLTSNLADVETVAVKRSPPQKQNSFPTKTSPPPKPKPFFRSASVGPLPPSQSSPITEVTLTERYQEVDKPDRRPRRIPLKEYVCSLAALFKVLAIVLGVSALAVFVQSRGPELMGIELYILIAFIISWTMSVLILIARLTGWYAFCQTPCLSFDGFDYLWSLLSFINFLWTSILLACFFGTNIFNGIPCDLSCPGTNTGICRCAQEFIAMVLGFATSTVYYFEAVHLRSFAPLKTVYGLALKGLWRMLVIVLGGASFVLILLNPFCRASYTTGCSDTHLNAVLGLMMIAWIGFAIIYILYLLNVIEQKIGSFQKFEFTWSVVSCVLFFISSTILLSAYVQRCSNISGLNTAAAGAPACTRLLGATVLGFIVTALFIADTVIKRDLRPAAVDECTTKCCRFC